MDTTPQITPAQRARLVPARLAISAEFVILGSNAGVWAVHIPVVQTRLALDPATIGVALLIMGIGAVLTMPLTGLALARWGSRWPTAVLGYVNPILLPISILSGSTPFLFVSLFILGASNGGLDVAMNTQAAEVEIARGKPTMSSFHGFFSVGALIGSAAGGALIAAGLNDGKAALVITAVMLALAAWSSFNLWPNDRPVEGGPRFQLPNAAVLGLGIVTFLAFAAEGTIGDWSALYLATEKGAGVAAASFGFIGFSIVMVVGRLTGDWIVAWLGGFRTLLLGGALTAGGILIAVLAPWPIVVALGFAIVGAGTANMVPVAFSAAAQTPGVPSSVGVAAVTTLGYAGFLFFPPILGFVANAFNLSASYLIVVAMGVVIAALAPVARR